MSPEPDQVGTHLIIHDGASNLEVFSVGTRQDLRSAGVVLESGSKGMLKAWMTGAFAATAADFDIGIFCPWRDSL